MRASSREQRPVFLKEEIAVGFLSSNATSVYKVPPGYKMETISLALCNTNATNSYTVIQHVIAAEGDYSEGNKTIDMSADNAILPGETQYYGPDEMFLEEGGEIYMSASTADQVTRRLSIKLERID